MGNAHLEDRRISNNNINKKERKKEGKYTASARVKRQVLNQGCKKTTARGPDVAPERIQSGQRRKKDIIHNKASC